MVTARSDSVALDAQVQSWSTTGTMIAHRVSSRKFDLARGATARLFLVVGVALALSVGIVAPSPQAHAAKKESSKARTDARELQAREAFVSGRYREALDLYAKLYAEKLHPTYLRNIGRCHQNMEEAEEAILSFRDYLRKAHDLPASEREEVEGFIKEMEALRERLHQAQQSDKQAAPAQTTAVPAPIGPSSIGPYAPPAGGAAGAVATVPAGADLSATPTPESHPPVYKRTWFWVAVGTAVAVGVVGALWAGGAFSKSSSCPSGYVCP